MSTRTQTAVPLGEGAHQSVERAYDVVAPFYDAWKWQTFWDRNELPIVSSWLSELPAHPRRALDLGTGTGRYTEVLDALGIPVVGLDVSRAMLARARARIQSRRVRFVHGDLFDYQDAEGFDLVLACRVLSHLSNLPRCATSIRRLVRPKAALLITDLDPEHRYRQTRVPTSSESVKIDTYKHSSDSLAKQMRRVGFALVRERRFTFEDLKWKPAAGLGFSSLDRTSRYHVFFMQQYTLGV